MAIKDIITRGIGFNPGSISFIVTRGYTSAEVCGPNTIKLWPLDQNTIVLLAVNEIKIIDCDIVTPEGWEANSGSTIMGAGRTGPGTIGRSGGSPGTAGGGDVKTATTTKNFNRLTGSS